MTASSVSFLLFFKIFKLLVYLHIVCVRLTLVPDGAAHRVARQWGNAALEQIAGLVGVALQGIGAELYVVCAAAAHPRLYAVVGAPVGEDVDECGVMLDGVAVDERLDGGTAHGIADEAYGHAERVAEQSTEVVGDGREVGGVVLGEGVPLGGKRWPRSGGRCPR